MLKRICTTILIIATLLVCGCGKGGGIILDVNDNQTPVQSPKPVSDKPKTESVLGEIIDDIVPDVFVPDYKPGEENTTNAFDGCIRRTNSAIHLDTVVGQGDWLYSMQYITWPGACRQRITKMPVDGNASDVIVLLDEDTVKNRQNGDMTLQTLNDEDVILWSKDLCVINDWLYWCTDIGDIWRMRTDGKIIERVVRDRIDREAWEYDGDYYGRNYVIYDDWIYYTTLEAENRDSSAVLYSSNFMRTKTDGSVTETIHTGNKVENNTSRIVISNAVRYEDKTYIELYTNFERVDNPAENGGYKYLCDVLIYDMDTENLVVNRGPAQCLKLIMGSETNQDGIPIAYGALSVDWLSIGIAGANSSTDEIQAAAVYDNYLFESTDEGLRYYAPGMSQPVLINSDTPYYIYYDRKCDYVYYNYGSRMNGAYTCRVHLDGTGWEDVTWIAGIDVD